MKTETRVFDCICGLTFRGVEETFKNHLWLDCPVFREALNTLESKQAAKKLGSIKSKKKAKASRLNGKKGGRPKSPQLPNK